MINTVLVANRGEIACRILRACSEAGLNSIAIYAENDAGSLFTELATIAVPLVGDTIGETYLNQQQILTIATEHGADAIHPGFGFLSERADFAQAVIDVAKCDRWAKGKDLEALDRLASAGILNAQTVETVKQFM